MVRVQTAEPQLLSTLTCPHCGHRATEHMPTDACVIFYDCPNCGETLKPLPGDCCVFCSYGSVPCPPIQAERAGSNASCCSDGQARRRSSSRPAGANVRLLPRHSLGRGSVADAGEPVVPTEASHLLGRTLPDPCALTASLVLKPQMGCDGALTAPKAPSLYVLVHPRTRTGGRMSCA